MYVILRLYVRICKSLSVRPCPYICVCTFLSVRLRLSHFFCFFGEPVLRSYGFEIFKGRHGRLRMADVELSGLSGRSGGALGSPRGLSGVLSGGSRGALGELSGSSQTRGYNGAR